MDVSAFLDLTASTARAYIEPLKDMLNTVRMALAATRS